MPIGPFMEHRQRHIKRLCWGNLHITPQYNLHLEDVLKFGVASARYFLATVYMHVRQRHKRVRNFRAVEVLHWTEISQSCISQLDPI